MTDTQIRAAFKLVLGITQTLNERDEDRKDFLSLFGKLGVAEWEEKTAEAHAWRLKTLAKYKTMIQEYVDKGKPEVYLNMSPEDIQKVYDIVEASNVKAN